MCRTDSFMLETSSKKPCLRRHPQPGIPKHPIAVGIGMTLWGICVYIYIYNMYILLSSSSIDTAYSGTWTLNERRSWESKDGFVLTFSLLLRVWGYVLWMQRKQTAKAIPTCHKRFLRCGLCGVMHANLALPWPDALHRSYSNPLTYVRSEERSLGGEP